MVPTFLIRESNVGFDTKSTFPSRYGKSVVSAPADHNFCYDSKHRFDVLDLAQIKDLRFRKVDSKIPGTLSVHTKKGALLHGTGVSIAWSIARAIGDPGPEETVHFMPR